MLDQTTEINLLYDFYSSLLTEKQRTLLEMYYHEDWSLGEIAEHQGVSRQAVFEAIKRAQATLTELEAKLCLMNKHIQRKKWADEILHQLAHMPEAKAKVETLLLQMIDE